MHRKSLVQVFVVWGLILLMSVQNVQGGKLGKLRSAVREKPKAKQSSSDHQSSPTQRRRRDDRDDDSESPVSQVVASLLTAGANDDERKLRRVRKSTRRPAAHSPRPSAPSPARRRQPSRSHRARPNHNALGLHFYTQYAAPVPLPTVVEHHYYDSPALVVQPTCDDTSYVLPPPPEPTVHPVIEPISEPAMANACAVTDLTSDPLAVKVDPFEVLEPIQVRFEIDYATDEADVDRTGFGLLFNATGGIGVDTSVRIFRERDADFRDHLWLGDVNLVYELFPTKFFRTRAGVGANFLADSWGAEAGLNLTVGSELFAGPLLFSGEMDLGTLGDADLFHGRLTAAIRQGDHVEWFAGYDYLDVGGTEIRGVVGGIRFRY